MKICTKCKESKELSEFYKRSDCNSYTSHCKKCKLNHDKQKGYYKKDKNYKDNRKERYSNNLEYRNNKLEQRKKYVDKYNERIIYQRALNRAKKFNLEFNLDYEDIVIPELCPLLEIPLYKGTLKVKSNSPSLDRIDNSKGYIKGNVAIISNLANTMKSNASKDDIIKFCKNITEYINNDIVRTSVNKKSEELEDKEPLG